MARQSTFQQANLATTAMRSRAIATWPDASYGYTMRVGLQADMTCVRSDGEGFATHAQLATSTPAPGRLPLPIPHGYPGHLFILSMLGPILSMLEHRPLHQDVRRKTPRGCASGLPVHEHRPFELLFTAMPTSRMLPKLQAAGGLRSPTMRLPARPARRLRRPTLRLRPARAL